jgi:hypothetical protein
MDEKQRFGLASTKMPCQISLPRKGIYQSHLSAWLLVAPALFGVLRALARQIKRENGRSTRKGGGGVTGRQTRVVSWCWGGKPSRVDGDRYLKLFLARRGGRRLFLDCWSGPG